MLVSHSFCFRISRKSGRAIAADGREAKSDGAQGVVSRLSCALPEQERELDITGTAVVIGRGKGDGP